LKMLNVVNLVVYYGLGGKVVKAVDGVDFSVGEGEALGLVGESGCGKTSTGLAVIRMLPPNVVKLGGKILFEGIDILSMNPKDFAKEYQWRKISMVFQGAMNSFNPVLRVGLQVAEPLMVKEGVSKAEALNRARQVFRQVGLPPEYVDRYPHELSGGMKQRALVAMALIMQPKLIILDEPTSALDVSIQTQIMNMLKRLKREHGLSMIFITHDLALVSDIADEIAVMYAGKVVELGPSEKILCTPLHPYSSKLLSSTPRLKGPRTLDYIPGAPPSLTDPPTGCRFHPRCHRVFEKCVTEEPPCFVQDGVGVRCWLYQSDEAGKT